MITSNEEKILLKIIKKNEGKIINKNFSYPLLENGFDEKDIFSGIEVLLSRKLTMSQITEKFERNFANYVGSKYAVMVNSGSSANLLMIASLFYTKKPFLKPGDEVIVPAISWSTTYFPLHQYGLKIKFVDIDKHTLNLDIEKLKKALTSSTKLIMAVNLLGNPNHFDEIKSLIKNVFKSQVITWVLEV